MKKCSFCKDIVGFFGFVVLIEEIKIKDEKIKIIKICPELISDGDIQVFLDFENFYGKFFRNFNGITESLNSML